MNKITFQNKSFAVFILKQRGFVVVVVLGVRVY